MSMHATIRRRGGLGLVSAICVAVAALETGGCASSGGAAQPAGVKVYEVARFDQDQVTGVAVSRDGRVFACFPAWRDGHRIHVAEVLPGGDYRPYPDAQSNAWHPGPAAPGPDQFVCVQSVHVDAKDRLWVLDPASPRMEGVIPGAAKLVQFDLKTNAVVRTIRFSESVAPRRSYLNDLRVDPHAEQAVITDSGLGALVVVDLASGTTRRVLDGHPALLAEPGFVPVVGRKELRFAGGPNAGTVPQVHSDGIALDWRRGFVYWQALTGRTLYRLATSALFDASLSREALKARIESLGRTVMTDGMEVDARGTLYFSALEQDAIVARTPDGQLISLVSAPELSWPDSFALGPAGDLYFTVAAIHRTDWFDANAASHPPSFHIFRMRQLGR